MSNQQNRDINKFATMFGLKMGRVSVEKLLPGYLIDIDLDKLSNKTTKIVYLLENNKSNINELQYIIEQILSVHSGWEGDVGALNNILGSLGLFVNPNNHKVEKKSGKGVEDVLLEIEKEVASEVQLDKILPSDILDDGKRMAESYLLIYCFENTLRIFIDRISIDKYGEDYWDKLVKSREVTDSVTKRKKNEEQHKFHSLRGDKELFYLDMGHLLKIIEQNWDIFTSFFPSQDFIRTRISETVITRNHVAHNGWISEDDFNRVLTYYKDILKQLS